MSTVPPETIATLAPHGVLRAAINLGNAVLAQPGNSTHADAAPTGITPEIAFRLGEELGVPVRLVPFNAAGLVAESAANDVWDVAFLGIDPQRAAHIAFTAPYLLIEGTYAVRKETPFVSVADVDQPGMRIAAARKSAYDLFLKRTLRHAELVYTDTSQAVVDLMLKEDLDAAAGIRQPLIAAVALHEDIQVLADQFMSIEQAMGMPLTRLGAGHRFLCDFVERAKFSGFVETTLQKYGARGATVAASAE
ncbi:polar amino acid transport system substrate-binding protein [Paraburkholderia sp. CI2]|uniref:transporter substrate-binding domain-containing protein n=1 Tax=Paraburkholderia sp. CI2 TaxID=2723093 RepID=UPI00161F42B9|nr:transporter substrate-binding domain-containing protein [Paraburkholderia sp. CI2]MBB5466785.1 polar amino acid transport system substrate-binding protein [Paraburkholderia sp. CI2]